MPYLQVNGASLYFETYGKPSDRPPIVLIHGSTVTGRADWRLVAPLLGEQYFVIVPDCRGHGQSSNPALSYSFAEMAADIEALVCQLGFERAHIIGHSNGGNVALVTLMEYPQVVQTAVLQAANAYVSPDLIEKEPRLFDPERVRSERPTWMEDMIGLHGPTHGVDYWRTLLQLTLRELISQPNYTPQDLQAVQKPTLVIQGELDSVNVPGRHAQFIAEHIPHAELWMPSGVGHNVHLDRLIPWVERILDFLTRRGDDANDALYRLKKTRYADSRINLFQVQVLPSRDSLALEGKVLHPKQKRAALEALHPLKLPVHAEACKVMLDESTPWALGNRNVVDLRREPRRQAERESQILLGEAVRILEEDGEWARVRLEHDGCLGWVPVAGLYPCSQMFVSEYHNSCQALVMVDLLPAGGPDLPLGSITRAPLGKIPFGVALPVAEWDQDFATVYLPDSRIWRVPSSGLLPLNQRPKPDEPGIDYTLNLLQQLVGTPYLWGGRSPFGIDCSGLAQAFLRFMGLNPPRDSDQQYQAGEPVNGELQPGDLLFFGEHDARVATERYANVSHVAISLGGTDVLHSSSTVGGVKRNSLDPNSPIYHPWLNKTYIGARRYL